MEYSSKWFRIGVFISSIMILAMSFLMENINQMRKFIWFFIWIYAIVCIIDVIIDIKHKRKYGRYK